MNKTSFEIHTSHIHNESCNCEACILKNMLFNHLPQEEAEKLCFIKKEIHFQKGEVIVKENDPIEYFFYLKNGLIKISKMLDNNKQFILMLARPHDYISLLSYFHKQHYSYTMIAIEESVICVFPLDHIQNLMISYPEFTVSFLQKVNKTADHLIERFLTINSRNLRGRIALILLELSEKIYHAKSFEIPFSRKEMSELIGMTTENVIRILSEFKNENIIKISGKEIEIVNNDKLKFIAEHG